MLRINGHLPAATIDLSKSRSRQERSPVLPERRMSPSPPEPQRERLLDEDRAKSESPHKDCQAMVTVEGAACLLNEGTMNGPPLRRFRRVEHLTTLAMPHQ